LYYIKYQQNDGKWRFLNSETKKFTAVDTYYDVKESKFDMLSQKDLTLSDESALIYLERFDKWCDEIKNMPFKGFDYRKQFMDSTNVTRLFNYYSIKNYKHHDPVCITEYLWVILGEYNI
jgi:hypothetical protein